MKRWPGAKRIRIWHRYLAWVSLLPLTIILTTGILLHLRRVVPWIQPSAQKSLREGDPAVSIAEAFFKLRSSKETRSAAEVESWKDIKSVDYNPSQGTWSFKTKNNYEVQIDGQTGAILSVSPRRSLWLIKLHEGSFFVMLFRLFSFIPVSIK